MDNLLSKFMKYALTIREKYKEDNKSLALSIDSQFAAIAILKEAIENINVDVCVDNNTDTIHLDADFQPTIEVEPQFDITVDSNVSIDDACIELDTSEIVTAIGDLDTMLVKINRTFERIQKDVTRAVDLMYMNNGVWLDPEEEMQENGKPTSKSMDPENQDRMEEVLGLHNQLAPVSIIKEDD